MPQLYFHYGCVSSAKSMNLLSIAHTYIEQGKSIIVIKPATDTRDGHDIVKSRCGIERKVDLLINNKDDIFGIDSKSIDCILCDEGQFLKKEEVDALKSTDFKTELFEGSKRLIEISHKRIEVKTTCIKCNKKAEFNLRHNNGVPIYEGDQIMIGGLDKYYPVCSFHYDIQD
jgi:thymidine kinase